MGTIRLSKPTTQIKMEQNSTGSRTLGRESSALSCRRAIDSSGAVARGRKRVNAIQKIWGTRSVPFAGGVLTGEGRSLEPGESAQQQPDAPESQPQLIPHSGFASPLALNDRGKA